MSVVCARSRMWVNCGRKKRSRAGILQSSAIVWSELSAAVSCENLESMESTMRFTLHLKWAFALLLLASSSRCAPFLGSSFQNGDELQSTYEYYVYDEETLERVRETIWQQVVQNFNRTILAEFSIDSSRLCVPIRYSLVCPTCKEDSGCSLDNGVTEMYSFVWTRFNTSRLSGKAIFYFVSMDARMPEMPGFGWSEACGLNYEYDSDNDTYSIQMEDVPVINVTIDNRTCIAPLGLTVALQYITMLVGLFVCVCVCVCVVVVVVVAVCVMVVCMWWLCV